MLIQLIGCIIKNADTSVLKEKYPKGTRVKLKEKIGIVIGYTKIGALQVVFENGTVSQIFVN